MRVLFVAFALLSASAFADNIDAKGFVFYKMPKGELVKRDAVLSVPVKGEGKVYLTSGGKKVEAHGFTSTKLNGRTVFYVVFLNPPGSEGKTAVVFRGTYTRGTNAAIYYGDFFAKSYRDGEEDSVTEELLDQEPDQGQQQHAKWNYAGGFGFGAKVN